MVRNMVALEWGNVTLHTLASLQSQTAVQCCVSAQTAPTLWFLRESVVECVLVGISDSVVKICCIVSNLLLRQHVHVCAIFH